MSSTSLRSASLARFKGGVSTSWAVSASAPSRCCFRMPSTRPTPAAGQAAAAAATAALHTSATCRAVTNLSMPAMSPTMTEGGVSSWKVKEGQAFAAGDVLLEIETDKATMDVEAQDDGIMGKIVVQDGTKDVKVGHVIALLAEEGDDISNLEAPKEEAASASAPAPAANSSKPEPSESSPPKADQSKSESSSSSSAASTHSPSSPHPSGSTRQFPSVSRLLSENHVSSKDAASIPATGVRGMLTKGDVLAHLGLAKSPTGSFTVEHKGIGELGGRGKVEGQKEGGAAGGKGDGRKTSPAPAAAAAPQGPLEASTIRSLILSGLSSSSSSARARAAPLPNSSVGGGGGGGASSSSSSSSSAAFDALLDDYAPPSPKKAPRRFSAKFGVAKDAYAALL